MTPPYKTYPDLNTPHGFFGRQGGVSEGIYESLNAGERSEDSPMDIAENHKRIADALQADHLVSLHQIHSDQVEIISEPPASPLKVDGLVTKTKGLALSVLSADCGPVLFEDAEAGVIGVCHAGWRGALGGIVESTVAALCEAGATPANISAVLGACISQPNYEVGNAFKSDFMEIDETFERFFKDSEKDIPHFDLPGFILSRLKASGVTKCSWTGECTYGNPDLYFSYRRNTHEGVEGYGRNLSVIILR
jgi:YfiH family protein